MQVKLPDLGEGIESGDVVAVNVKPGQKIAKDETLIEIETDKAVIPVPSTADGNISQVHVKEGDRIQIGAVIVTLGQAPEVSGAEKTPPPQKEAPPPVPAAEENKPPVKTARYESASGLPPPASPSVRKLAAELGVDLGGVSGSEDGGRITLDDLKAYVRGQLSARQSPAQAPGPAKEQTPAPKPADFEKWGAVETVKMSRLRKTIAGRMSDSWQTIPHVTQFDEADITDLIALRKKYNPKFKKEGGHLTLTAFAIKAIEAALKKFPNFNASIDVETGLIVRKSYYNIGIAVDTDEGLIVPVLKDIDKKSLLELSIEMVALTTRAKERKSTLDELRGGTFTISNLGTIGGSFFTPIINKPEVAILGLGSGAFKPVWKAKQAQQRVILPVSLSYDHRIIDGANGARFIRKIVNGMEEFSEKDIGI